MVRLGEIAVDGFKNDLCEALGLKDVLVQELVIRLDGNERPTVEVTYIPDDVMLSNVLGVVTYYMVEEDGSEATDIAPGSTVMRVKRKPRYRFD